MVKKIWVLKAGTLDLDQSILFVGRGFGVKKRVPISMVLLETDGVVMDGRDIGTNVFPDAEIKFFVTATAEERAKRRYLELLAKGETVEYQAVLSDMKTRDYNDSTRSLHPLKQAEDAILLDTTHMTIEEVIAKIMEEIERCQL